MVDLARYDALIFDLGGVLINLDFEGCIKAFQQKAPHLDVKRFNGNEGQHPIFSEFEVGKLSSAQFLESFNLEFKASLSMSDFESCWNSMILDFPSARIEILKQLRRSGKRLFLLSNINETHELEVARKFESLGYGKSLEGLFDRVYFSHRIGKRKPSHDAFQTILSENTLNPSQTLFIDDSIQHITAARALGIDALHVLKPDTILELLS